MRDWCDAFSRYKFIKYSGRLYVLTYWEKQSYTRWKATPLQRWRWLSFKIPWFINEYREKEHYADGDLPLASHLFKKIYSNSTKPVEIHVPENIDLCQNIHDRQCAQLWTSPPTTLVKPLTQCALKQVEPEASMRGCLWTDAGPKHHYWSHHSHRHQQLSVSRRSQL